MVSVIGFFLVAIGAQPAGRKSNPAQQTTNWVGCLVVGKTDLDPIAIGPHPLSINDIQIGLRSDGILVWRRAADAR